METRKQLATAVKAAILSLLTACGPTQEECKQVFGEDSRPVDGACLDTQWEDLDALRTHCGRKVEKAWSHYPYTYTSAEGWRCQQPKKTRRCGPHAR